MPPFSELGPNKFHGRLSGASRIQANLLAAGTLPEPRWGSIQRFPDPVAGGKEAGCPFFENPTPRSRPFGPRASAHLASPLTRNGRLGLSQHDGLDAPTRCAGL